MNDKIYFERLDPEGKFILIKLNVKNSDEGIYVLKELKLIQAKATKRFSGFEFTPEVISFFKDIGYLDPLTIISKMKKDGLIVPVDYANLFKLIFI